MSTSQPRPHQPLLSVTKSAHTCVGDLVLTTTSACGDCTFGDGSPCTNRHTNSHDFVCSRVALKCLCPVGAFSASRARTFSPLCCNATITSRTHFVFRFSFTMKSVVLRARCFFPSFCGNQRSFRSVHICHHISASCILLSFSSPSFLPNTHVSSCCAPTVPYLTPISYPFPLSSKPFFVR